MVSGASCGGRFFMGEGLGGAAALGSRHLGIKDPVGIRLGEGINNPGVVWGSADAVANLPSPHGHGCHGLHRSAHGAPWGWIKLAAAVARDDTFLDMVHLIDSAAAWRQSSHQ